MNLKAISLHAYIENRWSTPAQNVVYIFNIDRNESKCHFAQVGLKALGRHVSRLGLATAEDKVAAVKALEFPQTLRHLEMGIGYFGYHRRFIDYYAAIERPL
jgi:hypothetical protein